jgi:competence protein ComEC
MNFPDRNALTFLSMLIPYAAGIIFFYNFNSILSRMVLIPVNLSLFIVLLVINIRYQALKAYQFKTFTGFVFQLLCFFFAGLSCVGHTQYLSADYFAKVPSGYLKVRINDEPQYKGDILKFKASVLLAYQVNGTPGQQGKYLLSRPASGTIMIAIKVPVAASLNLGYGDELIIPSRFSEIKPPDQPSEFDFKSWLATQNIYQQIFLKPHQYLKIKGDNGNPVLAFALELRNKQVKRYASLIKNKEAISLASTLILGYRADLGKETLDIYSKTGTIHALSVSGMHVGLIYMVLNILLSFLNPLKRKELLKLILILPILWFYALLTGLSPSVLRSVMMLSVFLIAKSSSRPANSYNIIAFSAFGILLYNPFLLWDVGFQLSFLAVTGLIYLQPKIQQCWYIENKWLHKLWGLMAMSFAAQLFTFPASVYYFHQFPLYFLISTLFIIITIALLMYLGILLLFPGFDFLAPFFEWLINFTNQGLQWIANLPFASISGIWISKIELVSLCFALTFLVMAWVHFQKKALLAAIASFLILQSCLSYDQLSAYHQRKIIRFKIPKQQATAYLFSNHATICTTLKQGDKAFVYFIQPALDQHKIKFVKLVPP